MRILELYLVLLKSIDTFRRVLDKLLWLLVTWHLLVTLSQLYPRTAGGQPTNKRGPSAFWGTESLPEASSISLAREPRVSASPSFRTTSINDLSFMRGVPAGNSKTDFLTGLINCLHKHSLSFELETDCSERGQLFGHKCSWVFMGKTSALFL